MAEKLPPEETREYEILREEISIPSQGQAMEGTLYTPKNGTGPYAGVLVFPGMTGTKTKYLPMLENLAKRGVIGLAINLRAHGGSEGTMQTLIPKDGYQDVLAAFDYLAARNDIDTNRIGVLGSSYGGMLTGLLARDRKIKSIVLRGPAAYTDEMLDTTYENLMKSEAGMFHAISDLQGTPALEAIQSFDGNLLAVASEKDDIIPLRIPQAYLTSSNASEKELRIIKDAPHSLHGPALQEFENLATDWFGRTL